MANGAKRIEPLYTHWNVLSGPDYNAIILDFKKYCEEATIIINKEGQAVPFILNEAQIAIVEFILPFMFAAVPSPVTLVIHKSRQEGVSVLLARLEQYVATRRKNLSIMHLLPTDDLANKFYEQKAKPLLEGTHPSLLPEVLPVTKPNVFLKFKEFLGKQLNSYIKIGGALSRGAGRSGTNQVVVFDEYAYYDKVGHLERGILATQPKTGLVLTVYVSTAKGVNHFYDVVKQARRAGSSMHYLFLPWHMLKEYEMEPQGRLKELTSLTEYELKLCQIFEEYGYPVNVWARKMQFYETVMEIEAKGDQEFMFSEYPSTPEESFQASGNPVFPISVLMAWFKRAEDAVYKYMEPRLLPQKNGKPKLSFVETVRSPIKVYKDPEYGKRYLLSVDPAGGGESGDFHAGVVLNEETMEEVCTFQDKIEQTELAELVVSIAKHYNNAIIIPERNMGSTLIEWIRLLGYYRIYVDPLSTKQRTLYGVHMTRPVKDEAIRRMRFLMINGFWNTHDKDFIDDSMHFVWKQTPGGLTKAIASGTHDSDNSPYHDDTVMARLVLVSTLDMRRWRSYLDKINERRRT